MPLDFSEAQAKIKEDENRRRVEEGLTVGLTKEVSEILVSCYFFMLACFVYRRRVKKYE